MYKSVNPLSVNVAQVPCSGCSAL